MGTRQNPDSIPNEISDALVALELRCMQAIRDAIGKMSDPFGSASPLEGSVDTQSSGMPAMPFMAYWNVAKDTWDMYLPSGSLIVDGKSVELDKPDPVGGGKKYLHVNTSKSPAEASIDGNATKTGCDYDIPLFEIGTDVGRYAVVKTQWQYGTVVIGSSSRSNGCFEPDYDKQGRITGVLRPYVMCGRQVVTASGIPTNGVNVVRVQHAYDSVTASIVSGSATPKNSSNTYTDIPLYKIKDYRIVEDYRNMPRVPLYDPKAP